jgi:hypothetical protein
VLGNKPPAVQKKLFSQALEAQKTYMMDCIKAKVCLFVYLLFFFAGMGFDVEKNWQGCDRHLMGLRILAMGRGGPPPGIFADPMYAKSTKWRLSTSTVRTTEIGGLVKKIKKKNCVFFFLLVFAQVWTGGA